MRMRQVIAEDNPTLHGYDQTLWATRLDYAKRKPSQSLDKFRTLRAESYELLKDLPKGWVEIDRDGVRVLYTRTHPGFSGTILSSTLQRPVEVPIFMSRGNSNDSRVVPWTWFFRDYYGQDPRPIDSNHDWRTGATTIALVGGANQIDPNATLTAVDAGDEARFVMALGIGDGSA